MIGLRTLGPMEVLVDGQPAPAELLWRKNLALLVYLARSPKRARARDHLIGLLWGDKPESAARHSLNEALRVLRRTAGEGAIETEGSQVALTAGVVELDTDRLEALAAAENWGAAAALVGGDFLEGFGVPDASAFESWVTLEREAWRHRGIDALSGHADGLLDAGDLREATAVAQRAWSLSSASEPAARILMKCLAMSGDRAAALGCYDTLVARLAADVGTSPDRETQEFADRVRRERAWRGAAGRGAGGHNAGASRRAPLVGRGAAMTHLVGLWNACRRAPRATILMVDGAPGTGKTRFAEELLQRVRLDGAVGTTIRAVEADGADPWGGVYAFANGDLLDAPGLVAAPPAALAAFAPRAPAWAERFAAALQGVVAGPPARAFVDLLRALAGERPVFLAVDDAHWLDRDSLLAFGAVVRDLARLPICILITAAPHLPRAELDDLRSRLGRDVPGGAARLEPLAAPDLRELARWAMPQYAEDEIDRLARRVALDTAGLPLLAVELLHAVTQGLNLRESVGAWPEPLKTLDQTLPGGLPDATVAAIRVNFRRLPPAGQQVLAAAAVLAERAAPDVLARATALPLPEVEAALDDLEWGRWLVADPRGYSFLARIVRDTVARDMVTAGQRKRMVDAANG